MPLSIVRNDITKMSVDVIVNAANITLKMGGGVCGAIFSAAGADKLQAECDSIGKCKVGEAVITGGYKLPAKHIIHTVGPIWQGGNSHEEQLLSNCYANSLLLAKKSGFKSIAFPLISSGIYGYPKDKALKIAISSIGEFILESDMTVYLVVYDKSSFVLSEKLFASIEKYIDDNYVEEHQYNQRTRSIESYEYNRLEEIDLEQSPFGIFESVFEAVPTHLFKAKRNLKDVVAQLDESFSQI